jgi:hypothetical protein
MIKARVILSLLLFDFDLRSKQKKNGQPWHKILTQYFWLVFNQRNKRIYWRIVIFSVVTKKKNSI